MSATTEPMARPRGRPPSDARQRLLDASIEVLKADGYAGLTTGKVAAAAGESKGLLAYHFGSKAGLVAAAGRELGQIITERLLAGVEGERTVEGILRGAVAAIWELLESDARLPRVYFDLNAVSVVDDEVRSVMREIKQGFREVLAGLLREATDAPPSRSVPDLAVLTIAGIEGLSLEWIERGDTPELTRARERFVRSIVADLGG